MSRPFVTLVLAATMSIGLEGGQSGSWQWAPTDGPPLSPASRVLTVGDAVFVGWFNGTWRSLDGGVNWQPVSKPLQSQPRMAAADGQLYAETQSGVIRSADAGDSFEPCGALPVDRTKSRAIESLAAHEATVYAAVQNAGLFRSRDRCASWAPMPVPPTARISQDGLFAGSGLLIIRANPRTLVSADQGDTWYEAGGSLPNPLGFAAECSGSVLATTFTGLFRSRDGGRTWTAAGLSGRPVRAVKAAGCEYLAAVVEVESQQPSRLVESADAGITWTPVDDRVGHGIWGIAVASSGARYAVGSAGAFRKTPGSSWEAIGPIADATSIAASGNTMIVRTSGGSTFQLDSGRGTWQPLSTHDHTPRTPYGSSPQSVGTIQSTALFARISNGILRSTDMGRTWRYARLDRFPHTVIALRDGTMLAGTEDGIFRLAERDEGWIERSTGLQEFRIAALAEGRGNAVFAASWEGRIYRSIDRGERWSPLGDAVGGPVYGLLETNDGALFVASGGHLRRWDYGERVWIVVQTTPAEPGQRPPGVWALMQMRRGTVVVAGGFWGAGAAVAGSDSMFISDDDGRTWRTVPSPGGRVHALAEDARGRLYAATTRGVWFATVR